MVLSSCIKCHTNMRRCSNITSYRSFVGHGVLGWESRVALKLPHVNDPNQVFIMRSCLPACLVNMHACSVARHPLNTLYIQHVQNETNTLTTSVGGYRLLPSLNVKGDDRNPGGRVLCYGAGMTKCARLRLTNPIISIL